MTGLYERGMTIGRKFNCMGVLTQKKYEFVEVVIMGQATFYYKNSNAPNPNKPNHIGATILINYDGKLLLESRKDSERCAFIGGGLF